ncbi:MAG TPA: FHA domain-containing protein [Candidatus Dormibacteraeota bacterium]|nr:FHA domain-containing protein [Candidatus Dormibacteraeota bacterium]
MAEPRLTVAPGSGIAASHDGAYLFIAEAADPAAEQLLTAWQETNDVDALFTVVRSRRPTAVTPFCAVFIDSAGVHVAIHGRLGLAATVNGERLALLGREGDSRIEETFGPGISSLSVGGGSLQLTWPAADAAPATVIGSVPAEVVQAQEPFEHLPTLAAAPAATDLGPVEVEGVLCFAGHFNDPESVSCRLCSASLGEEITRRPRPPLGRLLTQDGREFIVDRPLVVGRSPSQSADVVAGTAAAVEVPSTQTGVSRAHAELLVDGWAVLVRDLGSANGTYVLPAGISEWFRLEPDHAIQIEHGTVIAVGEFELKYEKPLA